MAELKAIDYEGMSASMAGELKGISLLPFDLRYLALKKLAERTSKDMVIEAFAHFIGLANSVVRNNREAIELFEIIENGTHPYTAEKLNLPTIFGALDGVKLVDGIDQEKVCGGCAYRLGSCANQSPVTTCDADWCDQNDHLDFLCHERVDDEGNPIAKCIGYSLRRKANRPAQEGK